MTHPLGTTEVRLSVVGAPLSSLVMEVLQFLLLCKSRIGDLGHNPSIERTGSLHRFS